MDNLQRQATIYAANMLPRIMARLKTKNNPWDEMEAIIAEAYAQGWVDRDTRDMKPETQDEFFNGE